MLYLAAQSIAYIGKSSKGMMLFTIENEGEKV